MFGDVNVGGCFLGMQELGVFPWPGGFVCVLSPRLIYLRLYSSDFNIQFNFLHASYLNRISTFDTHYCHPILDKVGTYFHFLGDTYN